MKEILVAPLVIMFFCVRNSNLIYSINLKLKIFISCYLSLGAKIYFFNHFHLKESVNFYLNKPERPSPKYIMFKKTKLHFHSFQKRCQNHRTVLIYTHTVGCKQKSFTKLYFVMVNEYMTQEVLLHFEKVTDTWTRTLYGKFFMPCLKIYNKLEY